MSWWYKGGGTDTLRKIAAAITKEYGIKVHFVYGGEATHTDVKKREITIDLNQAYKNSEDYAVGLLLHEVAHIRYSPQKPREGELYEQHPRAMGEIYNWLEDRRIDALMREQYAGAKEFQDALEVPTLEGLQSYLEKLPDFISTNTEELKKANVYRNTLAYATLEAHGYNTSFCEVGNVTAKGWAARIADIYKTISGKSTSAEIDRKAVEVGSILQQILPEDKEGEGHCVAQTLMLGGAQQGDSGKQDPNRIYFTSADERAKGKVPLLKRKLIAKLRDNETQKWEGNQRRGHLDKKRLVRIARDNYRIYRRKLEKKGKRYAFSVVIDSSGSMFNDWDDTGESTSIGKALEAGAAIVRTVRGLGFPASLTLYGNQTKTILLPREVYKPDTIQHRVNNLPDGVWAGGTNIVKGIAEGLKQLLKNPNADEKVLIVINDGGVDSSSASKAKEIVEQARRKGVKAMFYYIETEPNILGDSTREIELKEGELVPATLTLLKGLQV